MYFVSRIGWDKSNTTGNAGNPRPGITQKGPHRRPVIMSLQVEEAVPPPHLFSGRSATWPSSYTSQACSLGSSPALKSPQLPHTFSRMHESPMSSHNINNLATTGWFDPSVAANDFQVCSIGQVDVQTTDLVLISTLDTNLTSHLDLQWSFLHLHPRTGKEARSAHQQHMPTHRQE